MQRALQKGRQGFEAAYTLSPPHERAFARAAGWTGGDGALPFAALGHKRRVDQVRQLCAAEGGLAVVGGWLAGNGLAAIVADTPRHVAALLP